MTTKQILKNKKQLENLILDKKSVIINIENEIKGLQKSLDYYNSLLDNNQFKIF